MGGQHEAHGPLMVRERELFPERLPELLPHVVGANSQSARIICHHPASRRIRRDSDRESRSISRLITNVSDDVSFSACQVGEDDRASLAWPRRFIHPRIIIHSSAHHPGLYCCHESRLGKTLAVSCVNGASFTVWVSKDNGIT